MVKPKVLVTHSRIPKSAFEVFGDKYDLTISETKGAPYPSRETILKDIKGVDAVLWFGHIHVDKEMIDTAGKQLKVIGSMGAGYDHIDVDLLKERKIKVSHTPAILSNAVADMAVGLSLAVSRNILQGYNAIITNNWVVNHPTWMCGPTFEGSTVGVIGLGAIGSKIAQRIKSFEISQLLYYNNIEMPQAVELGAKFVSLDYLLANSDFVFTAIPLLPETRHLLNLEKFKKMKPTSVLVNTSRGEVINQDDLVTAIQNKLISGVALDVMYPEPLPHDHPLTKFPNVVLTPHISSATLRARETMARLAAQNIDNVLNGKELVTPIP